MSLTQKEKKTNIHIDSSLPENACVQENIDRLILQARDAITLVAFCVLVNVAIPSYCYLFFSLPTMSDAFLRSTLVESLTVFVRSNLGSET